MDLNLIIRYLRIVSGSLLFFYVVTHLSNHSLGIISIDAMEYGRSFFLTFWRNYFVSIILYSALAIHLLLGIYALARRKNIKLTAKEWTRNISAVLIPFFLAGHLSITLYGSRWEGLIDNYSFMVVSTWVFDFAGVIFLILMLILVWVHGVIGIHGLLEFRSFYIKYKRLIFSIYFIIPSLAIIGYVSAGLEALDKSDRDPSFVLETLASSNFKEATGKLILELSDKLQFLLYPSIIVAIISFYLLRYLWMRSQKTIRVDYMDGMRSFVSKGTSILETSQQAGITHEHVCGGRGRCTTCRVRVLSDLDQLPKPNQIESKVIKRLGFDKNVRLACQLRPQSDIKIMPLLNLNKETKSKIQFATQRSLSGVELETVILFTDIRGFTKMSDTKLPYDVVYILNKYFKFVVESIEDNGGRVDKFIGDGVMAIFDTSNNINENCKNALVASRNISESLKLLNEELKSELDENLKIGIGVHAGTVILGKMGFGQSSSETAIGDSVNIASRLEQLTKKYSCEIMISKKLADLAEINQKNFSKLKTKIRGKEDEMDALFMKHASEIQFG